MLTDNREIVDEFNWHFSSITAGSDEDIAMHCGALPCQVEHTFYFQPIEEDEVQ